MNYNITQTLKNRFLLFNLIKFNKNSTKSLATKASFEDDDLQTEIQTEFVPEYEENLENERKYEEYIEQKRNVSRFATKFAEQKFYKRLPTLAEDSIALNNQKYFRKIYARFGSESKIEPGVCWPTKSQLEEILKDEQDYDLDLKRKVEIVANRKQREVDVFIKR